MKDTKYYVEVEVETNWWIVYKDNLTLEQARNNVATNYSSDCQSSEFSQETVNNLYDYLVQVLEDDSLLKSATNTDKVIDYRGDKL